MIYEEFAVNIYDQNSFWIDLVFVLPMVALIIGFMWNLIDGINENSKGAFLRAGLCVIAFIGVCFVASSVAEARYAVDHQNERIAEENLKQKYDIVGVLWDETQTDPQSYDSLDEIKIQDNDSNIIEFRYRVDRYTHEPYLLNESESSHIKANDLLRIKTEK